MKIFLVAMPGEISIDGIKKENVPPLAIYILGSILEKQGYDIELLDASLFTTKILYDVYDKMKKVFTSKVCKEDIVCFSSNTFNWAFTKIACNLVKKKIGSTVILGGLHGSVFYDYIMRSTEIDYIIRGEGEETLIGLIDRIIKNKLPHDLPGICYRKEGKVYVTEGYGEIDFSKLLEYPLPLYDRIPMDEYRSIVVEASRGCLFNCIFCSILSREHRKSYPVELIKQQIRHGKKFCGRFCNTRILNFADDCFTADSNKMKEICNFLISEDDGFRYFIEARVNDLLKEDIIDYIPQGIIEGIQIGIECGYNEGLKKVGKGTDTERLVKCAKLLQERGLQSKSYFSFIIGFPWETEKEINLTLDMIEKLSQNYETRVSLNWLIFLPSRLWNQKEKYNIDIDESVFDNISWLSNEQFFYKTHPNINTKTLQRIERRIIQMQMNGCDIAHSMPAFSFQKKLEKLFSEIIPN